MGEETIPGVIALKEWNCICGVEKWKNPRFCFLLIDSVFFLFLRLWGWKSGERREDFGEKWRGVCTQGTTIQDLEPQKCGSCNFFLLISSLSFESQKS